VTVDPLLGSSGQMTGAVHVVADITERKAAQHRLAEHAAELQLLNSIDTAINQGAPLETTVGLLREGAKQFFQGWVADIFLVEDDGCLRLLKSAMPEDNVRSVERLLGGAIPSVTIADRADSLVFDVMRSGRPRLLSDAMDIERFMCECAPTALLHPLVPPARKALKMNSVILAPLAAGDRPLGLMVVSGSEPFAAEHVARMELISIQFAIAIARQMDVAELERHRHRLEELVAERTRELEQAQAALVKQERLAALGQVAGSVAHEIRNPLAAIQNAAYYLREFAGDRLDGRPARHLEIMNEQIAHANQVITTLLDFARGRPAELRSLDVAAIIEAGVRESGLPDGIRVVRHIPEDLPPVRVDESELVQVFRNLLVNAAQAMEGVGTIRISAGKHDNRVRVDVTDTGPGIRPEHLRMLFEPLFSTKSFGVGLGLALSKSFIEANHGTIEVSSEPGKGATFTITLPAAHAEF